MGLGGTVLALEVGLRVLEVEVVASEVGLGVLGVEVVAPEPFLARLEVDILALAARLNVNVLGLEVCLVVEVSWTLTSFPVNLYSPSSPFLV